RLAEIPISDASKMQLVRLYDGRHDPLAGKSVEEKLKLLKTTSYRDFLIGIHGCNEEVANCFQGRSKGFFGLGCDAVAAADLREFGYPGFAGLALPAISDAQWNEPYIYHFPDGNASLARLLVRKLIPSSAPGSTMNDIVLARFDYDALDRAGQNTRLRLEATCIDVRNEGDEVRVSYVRAGRAHRIAAKHAVLACFHMMIPHIARHLPRPEAGALTKNVKAPFVYSNWLIPIWPAWVNLRFYDISAPMSFHSRVALDFPVSLGGSQHSGNPSEPVLLHLEHVPGAANSGL